LQSTSLSIYHLLKVQQGRYAFLLHSTSLLVGRYYRSVHSKPNRHYYHAIMRFLSLLLLALATFSLAQDYEEETEDAIAEGRRRLRRIPSPQTQRDNNQVCDIRQYGITPYRASTPSILSSFSARIGGSWQRIDAVFPKSYAGTNLDAPFRAICGMQSLRPAKLS
jgi:hypothetical protein